MQSSLLPSLRRAAFAACLALTLPALALAAAPPPPTTPAGITLVEVVRELGNSQPQFLWMRIGDATGHTLFAHEKDTPRKSRCTGACAVEFVPLLAAPGAVPHGDWTLVRRSEGSQWAYQGRPLYSWSKELNAGEVSTNLGLLSTANLKLAEGSQKPTDLMPPQGWAAVRFTPAASLALPDGIDVNVVYRHQAVALTTAERQTLYAFDGDAKADGQGCSDQGCAVQWQPWVAPALATPLGEFSVVNRSDGTRQWAFRNRPLYLYAGDQMAGDVNGAGVDPRWSVAVLTQNFTPPGVAVALLEGYGDTLTADGMTLYGGYAFGKRWGGRNLRDTFKDSYQKGKRLGTTACDDAECAKSWRPLAAAADARSGGFWEPLTRPDGSRQWAYKGYALYTFAGDGKPGDHRGQAVYDFKKPEGDGAYLQRIAFYEDVGKASAAAGIYWNIAKP